MESLRIRAGKKALALIRERGLRAEDVRAVAGAAGGPKWLVLAGMDRFVFGRFLEGLRRPVHLVGASIGAWRFSAVCRQNPVEGTDRLLEAYIHQQYQGKPSAAQISREGRRIQRHVLSDGAAEQILTHPVLRLNLLSVRCRGPAASENRIVQAAGMLAGFAANFASRRLLRLFFNRTLFHHPTDPPPFFRSSDGLGICRVPLSEKNLAAALLASGSIPILMTGQKNVHGAPAGIYRDGGVIDYHMAIPFDVADGIVLFPHYMDRTIPGWFDKKQRGRKPDPDFSERVVRVAPSAAFVETLPGKKIPDRDDFKIYFGKDAERFSAWKQVAEKSEILAEDFMEALESGRIREMVEPLDQ
ncbi:MAG: patatin-like phospholipase family protein [Desulfobacterales bacterium]